MLTDTHAHLDFPDFASDFDAVLARAEAAGVHRIITIGTTVEGSHRAVALAERHRNVFATVGIHPGQAHETNPDFIPQLRTLARSPRVVAIGEIGRDHHRLPSILQPGPDADIATQDQAIKDAQASVFAQQLTLAAELGLNVVIHERDAWDDTLAQLAPYHGRLRAVFHCFGKSPQHARQLLAHNHLVSFTGIVTFKNAAVVQETARSLPAGTFMFETDCPFLAPVPHRGKRAEPGQVRIIAQHIADLRSQSLEELALQTEATANNFFRFSPSPDCP